MKWTIKNPFNNENFGVDNVIAMGSVLGSLYNIADLNPSATNSPLVRSTPVSTPTPFNVNSGMTDTSGNYNLINEQLNNDSNKQNQNNQSSNSNKTLIIATSIIVFLILVGVIYKKLK